MKWLFRVEGDPEVGLGHLRRSHSLACVLRDRGVRSSFLVSPREARWDPLVKSGFEVEPLPAPAWGEEDLALACARARGGGADGVVLVDSRRVTAAYLDGLVQGGCFVICRDDTAPFPFPCQVVLNGNADAPGLPYSSKSSATRFLLGTPYAVLSEGFRGMLPREVNASGGKLLIVLGGADPSGLMPRLIGMCGDLPTGLSVTAVLGPFFRNREEVLSALRESRREVRCVEDPEGLQHLMREADLAVAGGGQTLYELACSGCPTIAVQTASDQSGQLSAMEQAGFLVVAGGAEEPGIVDRVRGRVLSLLEDPEARGRMSVCGRRLVDGEGGARVVEVLLEAVVQWEAREGVSAPWIKS